MTRNWNIDATMPYPDTFSRLLITLVYATMDQLRGYSLTDPEGNGKYLFARHFITKEELDDLRDNPCWEPHYFLDQLRALMTKGYGHNKDAGMAFIYDANHKVHGPALALLRQCILSPTWSNRGPYSHSIGGTSQIL